MLGKLIKHDFRATWKVMVSLDAVLVVLGIMAAVVLQTIPHVEDSFGMGLFMFSCIGLFYIGVIAANIVSLIFLVIRYYRNLYTPEGYLTFTLPVKTDMIIHSKVITGSVWMLLCYLFTFISLVIAGAGFVAATDISRADLLNAMREGFSILGFGDPGFTAIMVFVILLTPFAGIVSMYFCISVGQLWQNHKILGAVLCCIGLYILNQIVTQVVFFASGFWSLMSGSGADIDATFGTLYKNMMLNISIVTFVEAVIFYIVCIFITRSKINLD
ncbi:MAG: hypothetical protein IKO16_04475 [Lachnospiraceae bacterium]|nr:hypothetical protein [Lachnospiraceae bacterium]